MKTSPVPLGKYDFNAILLRFFSQSFIAWLGVLVVLMLRGDGRFAMPASWPESITSSVVLFETVTLALFVWLSSRLASPFSGNYQPFTFITLALVLSIMIVALHVLQASYFAPGYRWDLALAMPSLSLALLALGGASTTATVWLRGNRRWFVFVLLLVAALALKTIPIFLFPITALRSDLLPIVEVAGQAWWRDETPYQYFMLDNRVATQVVRLPGLLGLYLPWSVNDLDLRWGTLFWELLLFTWMLVLALRSKSWSVLALGWVALVFFPYWHMRHELYEAPYWVVLALSLEAFRRGSRLVFAAAFGLALATHQWSWGFAPFLALGWNGRVGARGACLTMGGALVLGLGLLVWGTRGEWLAFHEHVFGYFSSRIERGETHAWSLYFFPLLESAGIASLAPWIQGGLTMILLYSQRNALSNISVLCSSLALVLTGWLLFNPVAWTYQYLLVAWLIWLGRAYCFTKE